MTIEITNPELEALIRQRMEAGAFRSPQDLIRAILRAAEPDNRTGAALIAALRACPDPDADIEPARFPEPLARDVSL